MRLEALSDFLVTILWGDKVRRYTILEHLNMTSIDGPGVSSIFMAELLHRLEMYAFEMALQPFLHRCERGTSLHSCFSYTHTYLPATLRVVEKRGGVAVRFSLVAFVSTYSLTPNISVTSLPSERAATETLGAGRHPFVLSAEERVVFHSRVSIDPNSTKFGLIFIITNLRVALMQPPEIAAGFFRTKRDFKGPAHLFQPKGPELLSGWPKGLLANYLFFIS